MAELRLVDGSKVILTSTDKFFQKGDLGRSSGGEEILEFTLELKPEDGPADITRAILETRRGMDQRVLLAEYLRGALSGTQLNVQRDLLQERYGRLLDELPADEEEPA